MHPTIETVGSRLVSTAQMLWQSRKDRRHSRGDETYTQSPFARIHTPKIPAFRWSKNVDPGIQFCQEMQSRAAPSVLEIGSRRIVAPLDKAKLGPRAVYTGLDILPGPNVDVVGDAHELSKLFADESFDGVVSDAVFEHIAMPWQVAREINRVLRPGGIVSIGTHHAYPNHELPWDFWRYGRDAFATIFNKDSGFEILNDGIGWTAELAHSNRLLQVEPDKEHYLFSKMLARKIGAAEPYSHGWDLDYRQALPDGHHYPSGTYQLKEEALSYGHDFEHYRPTEVSHRDWMRYIREILGKDGDGLLICDPSVDPLALRALLPQSWRWHIRITSTDSPLSVNQTFDAVLAWEPLSHCPHPWVEALDIAKVIKPNGSLFALERATPSYAPGVPEYWYFTSESLRLVYHPAAGLTQISTAFCEPWTVYPAKPELHQAVSTGPCYRWALGHFKKDKECRV